MTKKCWGCEKEVEEYWEHVDPVTGDEVMCDDCYEALLAMMAENLAGQDWVWCESGEKAGDSSTQSAGAEVIFNQLKGGERKWQTQT